MGRIYKVHEVKEIKRGLGPQKIYFMLGLPEGEKVKVSEKEVKQKLSMNSVFLTNYIIHGNSLIPATEDFLSVYRKFLSKIWADRTLYFKVFTQANSNNVFFKFYNRKQEDITSLVYNVLVFDVSLQLQHNLSLTDANRVAINWSITGGNLQAFLNMSLVCSLLAEAKEARPDTFGNINGFNIIQIQ